MSNKKTEIVEVDSDDDELTMKDLGVVGPKGGKDVADHDDLRMRETKKVAVPASAGPAGKRRKNKAKKMKKEGGNPEGIKGLPNLGSVDSPEDALEEMMANPQAFNELLKNINNTQGGLGDIVREVSSNPEAQDAVKEMMGAKGKAEQLRAAMQQRGVKMPTRKEALKMEKERKKAMNANRNTSKDINCIHVNASRKVKLVRTNPDLSLPLVNRDRVKRAYLGDLVVCYVPGTKPNKEFWPLVKDIWRIESQIGNEVFIHHVEYKDITWETVKENLKQLKPEDIKEKSELKEEDHTEGMVHDDTEQEMTSSEVSEIERRSAVEQQDGPGNNTGYT